jgi:hypothetical protein
MWDGILFSPAENTECIARSITTPAGLLYIDEEGGALGRR